MRAKPVVPRGQANRDVDEAIAYYITEGSEPAAMGFVVALEQAYARIGHHSLQPGRRDTPTSQTCPASAPGL